MCGIVGIVNRNAQKGQLIPRAQKMMQSIRYRGPDGQGYVELEQGVVFGHVRLAILDLRTDANQPMQSTSKKSTITYNGELYNHRALRAELQKRGFAFKTHSDTEVILNAYECWGDEFITKLNGMFAFAIYDVRDESIYIARDRLGIKPLYYYQDSEMFCFGSEMKSVIFGMNQSPALNSEVLLESFLFQNIMGSNTLVNGVKLFPQGTYVKITKNSGMINPKKFWEARTIQTNQTTEERLEELQSVFHDVLGDQIDADVPVSSFISGGIDSCSIASIITGKTGRIKTFTCGFDVEQVTQTEKLFDERARAEFVSSHIGSEHYEVVLKEDDFLASMSEWAWHAEEPRVGSSFPNFSVSYLASRFTKICMSGTGADELFGGYPWRYQAALKSLPNEEFIKEYYQTWNRVLSPKDYNQLVSPLLNHYDFNAFEWFNQCLTSKIKCASESDNIQVNAALLFEMETFLHGLLVIEDKASMAHGLEVRVPFVDNRLIDFALAMPVSDKISVFNPSQTSKGHYGKGSTDMPSFANGKVLLRKLLANYLPDEITAGRKQGFSPPVESWFRKKMQGWLSNHVFSSSSPLADYIDMNIAKKLWNEHIHLNTNHRLFIWSMVALHLFMTEFLGEFRWNRELF